MYYTTYYFCNVLQTLLEAVSVATAGKWFPWGFPQIPAFHPVDRLCWYQCVFPHSDLLWILHCAAGLLPHLCCVCWTDSLHLPVQEGLQQTRSRVRQTVCSVKGSHCLYKCKFLLVSHIRAGIKLLSNAPKNGPKLWFKSKKVLSKGKNILAWFK